jgi:NADH-quinone oxidoreductase subunit J
MSTGFIILALITIAGAIGAMNCGRLVHCALSLVASFAGLAGIYLQLNVWFVGVAQILVYVGAVAILIVVALLVTRNAESYRQNEGSKGWIAGGSVALLVFILLAGALSNTAVTGAATLAPDSSVETIGRRMMTLYVIPLEALALLLTAALLGAVVIALGGPKPGRASK